MNCARVFSAATLAIASFLIAGCGADEASTTASSTVHSALKPPGTSATSKQTGAAASAEQEENKYETLDTKNFDRSTTIDNEWIPLKPGKRFVWEGTTIDDEGDEEPHRVVFTVTDLTKVIGGVNTVVCWDQDFADDELVETEIAFFAQDNDGAVWLMGEYPEEYDDGDFVEAPCWIHGIKGSKAGILMPANPRLGTPSFSQGWAPSVGFTDRGMVYQMGEKVTVPMGSYEDVLVIDEFNAEEPDAHQLKYYARGVGSVQVGWRGSVTDQETLELITVEQLGPEDLAKARAEALKLESRGREISKDVFALTEPATTLSGAPVPSPAPETNTQAKPAGSSDQTIALGTEEFGLSKRELVQAIEKVEALIAKCMREQGFEYVAADYRTVRRGMTADKSLPGLSEEEFIAQHGFGVATMYTGQAPQLAEGYSPGKVGLGEQNVQLFKNLSPADQAAYNRALFGENTDATFAVGLETENFSRCGGCTRKAIEQVFKPEQVSATFYNPKDDLINKDSRMKAALRKFAAEMRDEGFDYDHPDEVETDIRERLYGITGGGTIPVEEMSPEQRAALKDLQDYERRVAVIAFELQEEIFEPVEDQIEKEMFAREVK